MLVLDIVSGGTTDILALHVRDDGTLEEISLGSGDIVGGQDINNAFFQACNEAFKGNIWTEVTSRSHAVELMDMETDFESKKVTIGLDTYREEDITLNVPDIFKKLLEEGKIMLNESGRNTNQFTIRGNKMYFNSKFIRENLFNETIRRILELLRNILQRENLQSVKHIALVGGFTESPIVVERIREFFRESFPEKDVIVPTSPLSAVMSGAVLYGHDPLIFYSRICRATYGIGSNSKFDSNLHREDKKWKNEEDNVEYCKDIFSVHVEKGSPVRLGKELPSKTYVPVFKDQTIVPIPIYMSTEQHLTGTVYTTDDHCKKLGEIEVEMPDTTGGTSREITVTMIYGGTELDVTAKNESSGEEYKSKLLFDTV